ncbi:MAG: hypothetical protein KGK01_14500 [Bradyrhizobium sp.]|uniref:hypothetical protein n=1 Tax=Bradyrhizobium sp. TaxID=376 RepID=UPI001C2A2529|nr:hypothetical protein [Bradyrhizobium sp.]MBU6462989.1 hypothetical protein [Pseudomonadota bacterium]MDE2066739.1 hypothetical protein [Bradyrhizobium sp.]MDE2243590.1 hypothetical protein [Bradyrhizobium sp.]MDE2472441.1 hypothetical protein [Bradyrhizobium sp.]
MPVSIGSLRKCDSLSSVIPFLIRLPLSAHSANLDFHPFESAAEAVPEVRRRVLAELLARKICKLMAMSLSIVWAGDEYQNNHYPIHFVLSEFLCRLQLIQLGYCHCHPYRRYNL